MVTKMMTSAIGRASFRNTGHRLVLYKVSLMQHSLDWSNIGYWGNGGFDSPRKYVKKVIRSRVKENYEGHNFP